MAQVPTPFAAFAPTIRESFQRLSNALSPENLSCDGELSMTAQRRALARIRKEWKALEQQVGRKVSEQEVWDAYLADLKARRSRA